MANPIDSPEYWIEDFRPSRADQDMLYEQVLEASRPFTIQELAAALVHHHVQAAMAHRQAKAAGGGKVYQPSDRYEKKQKLVFPALDGATGVVQAVRPGTNPDYGNYEVIAVQMENGTRSFAAGIDWAHALTAVSADVDPEALAQRYGPVVAPQLATMLASDRDWLRTGERWILRALLPDINPGHLNLSEAIIMLAGEPLPAAQILKELDVAPSLPVATRAMALEAAMADDERFKNVGAIESPLWAVTTQLG